MNDNIFYEYLNKDSVFVDKNKISPHYIPEQLPFREKEIKDLSLWISPALKKEKAHNVFIYGKVGTGKTSVVKHVTDQLTDIAKEKKLSLKTIYINCRNYQTKYAILFYCVQLFYVDKNFIGYSRSFIYDKFITFIRDNQLNLILVLDEIDKIKDKEIDDLIYTLSRSNDELDTGKVSLIGISNNLFFKSKLDPRTKSSLCEQEAVYAPYNASELKGILKNRAEIAFKKGVVDDSAINAAAAVAAKESGDARTAVMLLLRAGELTDFAKKTKVTDKEVYDAKEKVEQEIMKSMVLTLPVQLQLVLLAMAQNTIENTKGILKINGSFEQNVMYSGEVYEIYQQLVVKYDEKPVSMRWFREYITELEIYGFISTTQSGKGMRGNTTLIKLGVDSKLISSLIIKEFES